MLEGYEELNGALIMTGVFICFSDTVQLRQTDSEGGNREIRAHPQKNTLSARWDKHTFGYVMLVLLNALQLKGTVQLKINICSLLNTRRFF